MVVLPHSLPYPPVGGVSVREAPVVRATLHPSICRKHDFLLCIPSQITAPGIELLTVRKGLPSSVKPLEKHPLVPGCFRGGCKILSS